MNALNFWKTSAVCVLMIHLAIGCSRSTKKLIGSWTEVSRYDSKGNMVEVVDSVGWLTINESDQFKLAWGVPLETYNDFWGSVMYSKTNQIVFAILGCNQLPDRYNGTGNYFIGENGFLHLRGINFGFPSHSKPKDGNIKGCYPSEYVFKRIDRE